jgi:hypothetical protein
VELLPNGICGAFGDDGEKGKGAGRRGNGNLPINASKLEEVGSKLGWWNERQFSS